MRETQEQIAAARQVAQYQRYLIDSIPRSPTGAIGVDAWA